MAWPVIFSYPGTVRRSSGEPRRPVQEGPVDTVL